MEAINAGVFTHTEDHIIHLVMTGKETLSCNLISFDMFSHPWHMLLGEHVIWLGRKREAVFWQWDNKVP